MKLAIILLALVGLVAGWHENVKIADKDFLQKQKFLFEIVYRVEDPLMFEEWIQLGDKLFVDKTLYTEYDTLMETFWESWKTGVLLPKGEFFGALVKSHHSQAWGLFNFFYNVKDWDTFVRNVCWARINVNEGMFVYALTLAVIHRDNFSGFMLPAIYEIFPQNFLNSKFIYDAEKFDYDVWAKIDMFKKEYKNIYNNKDVKNEHDNTYHTDDCKVWQWWKMFGLGKGWHLEEIMFMRENNDEFNEDLKWWDIVNTTKLFYMPVDYTRDIEIFNDHTILTYFTEDLGWNAYWYYLNLDYAFFLNGKTYGLDKDRRGEYWLYNVQQLLARYHLERLSNGFGDIPQFSWTHTIEEGYNPHLIAYDGIGYSYRKNYWDVQSYGNFDMLTQIQSFTKRIYDIIDMGYYRTADGTMIDMRKPEAIEHIGNFMQGNIDQFDKQFFTYWYLLSHMYFGNVDYNDHDVLPNVFLNFETMLRDPMFYTFHKKIVDVFYRFKYHMKPYTREDLLFPGVTVKEVKVEKLVTFFDLVDFDVTNLLNDKMTFTDGKFDWDKTLLARQARLNHEPFETVYVIESDKWQKVSVRSFLGPKYDEFGRTIRLRDNRQNFIEIDQFDDTLVEGNNVFKRIDREIFRTGEDRLTYTELYKLVMMASEGKYELPLFYSEQHCGYPGRLLLPHGWESGMPMQMFFIVTPYDADQEQASNFDKMYSCGIGSGTRHVDNKRFGYPLDREINEYDFFVPNMYFKDVKIFHEDKFEKLIFMENLGFKVQ